MVTLKISENLFVTEKGNIFSYETNVGKISNGKIYKWGKFSRTTGKQFYRLSSLTGLDVKTRDVGEISFYKYHQGVKCEPPKSSLVFGNKLSRKLLIGFVNGDLIQAAIDVLSDPKELSPKDIKQLTTFLVEKGMKEDIIQKLVEVKKALYLTC